MKEELLLLLSGIQKLINQVVLLTTPLLYQGGIKLFLPRDYEDAQVRVEEVRKLNENYLGITVLNENQIVAPTFNLNQLYEMYQSDPEISMESIMRNITGVVLDAPEQFELGSITEYENAKKKLFIRVSSAEKNEEMLQLSLIHI